jgi:hypothetical protein
MGMPSTEKMKIDKIYEVLQALKEEDLIRIELYFGTSKIVHVWIYKKTVQNQISYFLMRAHDSIQAESVEELWQEELYKWKWGCAELHLNP